MKIKHLKVNGFGKLVDKELYFNNGINIVYGKNEAGKSTLLKFISCMLYGTSRNKNGKSISDFERYKPWKTEEYSGIIDYELDNNESYSIYREFKRKNPVVYNNYGEDISKSFIEDKNGINFFVEQTGIDEESYFNTAISEQGEITLSLQKQNLLVQKITNFVSTGDDNLSYQKIMSGLTKEQVEKIGTDRSTSKPINIVNDKINYLGTRIKDLENLRNNFSDSNLDSEKLSFRLKNNENKLKFVKKVKEFFENNRVKVAEINFNKNSLLEDNERIEEIRKELEELKIDTNDNKKINKKPYLISIVSLSIISIIIFAICRINYISLVGVGLDFIAIIIATIMLIKTKHLKNSSSKESFSRKSKLKFELDTLKEKKYNKEKEINSKNEKLELEIDNEKDVLINQFLKLLDINFIEDTLNKSYEDVLTIIDELEKKVSDIKLEFKELEINKRNYNLQIEELSKIEEELGSVLEEKAELISLNNSYNLAKECLEKAYEETKKNISPKFKENLFNIIEKISDNKYSEVSLDDQQGIFVRLNTGNYVPLERLSIGTIDQIYLSLRISAMNEMSNEVVPIIFDEAFAFFDNNRLENIIKYLNENYKDRQIIIFTCSNREQEILNLLNIEYNLINLEK